MSRMNNILSRFKKCTRCSCSTCLIHDETAAYDDVSARMYKEGADSMLAASGTTIKELERKLHNTKGVAQLLGILCALFTIVFYAKYGW